MPLDWSCITDDKQFHRLVNELFLSLTNFADYHPGDPRGGQDRGWDGLYTGVLPPPLKLGSPDTRWMVQVKYTSKKSNAALNYLAAQLRGSKNQKGELDKAQEQGAQAYVLVTQAPLKSPHAEALQKQMSDRGLYPAMVLHRENLESLLRDRQWLLYHFFKQPVAPGLVPYHRYQDGSESLPVAPLPFRGRQALLRQIAQATTQSPCVLIHGPAGHGKTRIVHEAAARAHTLFPGRQVLLYNRVRPATEVIQDELRPDGAYLVFIDDAERDYQADVRPFVVRTRAGGVDLALVLVCRDGAKAYLEQHLQHDGLCQTEAVTLGALRPETCLALIKEETALDEYECRSLFLATGGNLLLLAFAVQALSYGKPAFSFVSKAGIKGLLAGSVQDHAKQALAGVNLALPSGLLALLGLLVPLRPEEDNHAEAELIGGGIDPVWPEPRVTAALSALRKAGILRRVGRTLRFSADLVGDLLLEQRLAWADGEVFLRRILNSAMDRQPKRVIQRLAMAARLGSPTAVDALKKILGDWADEERRTPTPQRKKRLEYVAFVADILPEAALDLLKAVVLAPDPTPEQTRPEDHTEELRRRLEGETFVAPLNTDQVGPALRQAGRQPNGVVLALRLLRSAAPTLKEGIYDNHKPARVVQSWFTVGDVPYSTIEAGLGEIQRWLHAGLPDQPLDETGSTLAITSITTPLRASWNKTESDASGVRFGPVTYSPEERWLQIREQALALLQQALVHPEAVVRLAAAQATDEVGKESGIPHDLPNSLFQRVAEEQARLVRILGQRLGQEQDIGVLLALERKLLHTWLLRRPQADLAEEALQSFQRPLELRALYAAVHPNNPYDSFEQLRSQAPKQDPWRWWVSRSSGRYKLSTDDLAREGDKLARLLLQHYSDLEAFVALLGRLENAGAGVIHQVPSWLWALARLRWDLVEQIGAPDAAPKVLPPAFARMVQAVWRSRAPDAFARLRDSLPDINQASPVEVEALLESLRFAPDRPEEETLVPLLTEVARHKDLGVRMALVDFYVQVLHIPLRQQIPIFAQALATEHNQRLVGRFWRYILSHATADEVEDLDRKPLATVIETIVTREPWDREDHDLLPLLVWSLGGQWTALLGILEKRLEAGGSIWGILPHDGAHMPDMAGPEELSVLVERFCRWRDRSLLDEVSFIYLVEIVSAWAPDHARTLVEAMAAHRQENRLPTAMQILSRIPMNSDVAQTWFSLLRACRGTPHWGPVAERFASRAGVVSAFSSVGSEDPPALLARQELLRGLRSHLAPRDFDLAALVQRAEDYLRHTLERLRAEHLELMGTDDLDLYSPQKEQTMPVYVDSISLENVRCFGARQTLNLAGTNNRPRPWTVLLGDNGTGKTTLLHALAHAARALSLKAAEPAEADGNSPEAAESQGLCRIGSERHRAEVTLITGPQLSQGGRYKAYDPDAKPEAKLLCLAYGATRRMARGKRVREPESNGVANLMDEDLPLRNAEEWLLNADHVAEKAGEDQSRHADYLARVKRALVTLLPDVRDIRFSLPFKSGSSPQVEFFITGLDQWVPLSGISLGYRTVMAWAVDLASRLFDHYQNAENPLAEAAVVLVDEIDLHAKRHCFLLSDDN